MQADPTLENDGHVLPSDAAQYAGLLWAAGMKDVVQQARACVQAGWSQQVDAETTLGSLHCQDVPRAC